MIMTLFSALIKLTLTGSVMTLTVLLLRFVFKSKLPKTFIVFLWMLIFAAFVIPVSLPTPAFISGLYSDNISSAINVISSTQTVSQSQPEQVHVKPPAKAENTQVKPATKSKDAKAVNPYPFAAAAYGSISIILMILFSLLYAMTLKRFRLVSTVEDKDEFKNLRQKVGLRRAVSLSLSEKTSVPVTVGTIHSRIILPADFDLEKEELTEHIYVHELIHVKRRDNAVSLIALFIACLHWFNPLVWLAYSMLCRDLELACDSSAVKIFGYSQRSEYAQSLLIMAGKKRKAQPMLVTAFGKYNIKERVANIMNIQKISAKIISSCISASLVLCVSFTAVSCTKPVSDLSAAQTAASDRLISSTANTNKKNIATKENKKIFMNQYVMPYYYNVPSVKGSRMNFNGKITSRKMGDGIFLCVINNNNSGVNIEKYKKGNHYVLPEAIEDKCIKKRFDIVSINHSMISYYNAKKKAYVIDSGALGQGCTVWSGIKTITQIGNTVTVTVDFYGLKKDLVNPDYSKKIQSMKFTLKGNKGAYLYKKVETI